MRIKEKLSYKKVKLYLSIFITLFFPIYIVYHINWNKFILVAREIQIPYLIISISIYLISYYIRAYRIKICLGKEIRVLDVLGVNLLHNFYNRVLPARLGDFSLLFLLCKHANCNMNSSINIFYLIKIYDLTASLLILVIPCTFIFGIGSLISISLWLLFIVLLLIINKPSIILRVIILITKRSKFLKGTQWMDRITILSKDLETHDQQNFKLIMLAASLLIWGLISLLFYTLLLSIHVSFDIWDTLFATSLANFSWILPINGVGGFGTMEASWAYAFSLRGYSFNQTLMYALYVNVIVFLSTVLFTVFPYLKFRIRRTK